ncbi:cytochrome P450 family protein [Nonomuraea rhizosphaerae]|uniref:cytochrome P450 family protein n=1 Tax=Nonomuraea rhizosphaerae TaxID=2665663 RepID=UPI001C5EF710|nr:cytochrome P450 [Nonomuraea rhizosphaerae]
MTDLRPAIPAQPEQAITVVDPAPRDAHADCARLRRMGPLVPVEVDGVRAWTTTRYSTLETILSHPGLSRDVRHWDPEALAAMPPGTAVNEIVRDTSMLNAEGEQHRRLRGPLVKAFTPRRVRELRPRVEEIAAGLIDRMATLGPGPVDLRREFGYPLPREVISVLMGIPEERRAELNTLTDILARVVEEPEDRNASRAALRALLGEIIELKRHAPADDLITALIEAAEGEADESGRLSEEELFETVELIFVAGQVTTVNLLTNAVHALLRHPVQLARLRDGTLPWSAAVEETLRWDSPLAYFPMRYVIDDVEIDGVRLRKGEAVLACYTAAGRDPARYGPAAGRFEPVAEAPVHLSFGHGPHFCLGAQLARLEGEVALSALFEAFPELRAAQPSHELPPLGTVLGNSVRSLPVLLGERAR